VGDKSRNSVDKMRRSPQYRFNRNITSPLYAFWEFWARMTLKKRMIWARKKGLIYTSTVNLSIWCFGLEGGVYFWEVEEDIHKPVQQRAN